MLSFKYLSMAFRKSGKPGQDVYLTLFVEESLETNVIVFFVFVMVDCILCQNASIRLIGEIGFVLQRGKIVASIEQKPVSLNDIVTYGALIKNERDY
jgi:hypothetical protein